MRYMKRPHVRLIPDVRNTIEVLVDKVGHVVPFDTCVVYLYEELNGLRDRLT